MFTEFKKLIDSSDALKYFLIKKCDLESFKCGSFKFEMGSTRCTIVNDNLFVVYKFTVRQDQYEIDPCVREHNVYLEAEKENLAPYFAQSYSPWYFNYAVKCVDVEQAKSLFTDAVNTFRDLEREMKYLKGKVKEKNYNIELELYPFEKCTVNYNDCAFVRTKEFSDEENDLLEDIDSPLKEQDCSVAIAFAREYGNEEYERLSEFCENMGLNDLHRYNVGRRLKDNKLVVIDYAGYFDEEYDL